MRDNSNDLESISQQILPSSTPSHKKFLINFSRLLLIEAGFLKRREYSRILDKTAWMRLVSKCSSLGEESFFFFFFFSRSKVLVDISKHHEPPFFFSIDSVYLYISRSKVLVDLCNNCKPKRDAPQIVTTREPQTERRQHTHLTTHSSCQQIISILSLLPNRNEIKKSLSLIWRFWYLMKNNYNFCFLWITKVQQNHCLLQKHVSPWKQYLFPKL